VLLKLRVGTNPLPLKLAVLPVVAEKGPVVVLVVLLAAARLLAVPSEPMVKVNGAGWATEALGIVAGALVLVLLVLVVILVVLVLVVLLLVVVLLPPQKNGFCPSDWASPCLALCTCAGVKENVCPC